MGIYDLTAGSKTDARSLTSILSALSPGKFPDFIPAAYEILEGETVISSRINLGGMGVRADMKNQTMMRDGSADKDTFEDIDGLEWYVNDNNNYTVAYMSDNNKKKLSRCNRKAVFPHCDLPTPILPHCRDPENLV